MKNRFLIPAFAALLVSACTKDIPKEVIIDAHQLSIEGKTSNVIHADTSSIILVRDTLPDKDDGLYNVRTSLTILLDSLFYTDQMEDSLMLRLHSSDGQEVATLIPTDSLLADTLITYLQSKTDNRIVISFEGKMSGKSVLILNKGSYAKLEGFSFIYANPEITKRVNEYQELVQTISIMIEEARKNPDKMKSMQGFYIALILHEGFNKIEALNLKLLRMKDRMSPQQYAKFKEAHDLMKTYDKDLK